MFTNHQRDELIARLREGAGVSYADDKAVMPFEIDEMDARLAAGGLTLGGLHEVSSATSTLTDDAAATLFVVGIAARASTARARRVLWVVTRFDLYAPGLEQAGLDASAVLFVEVREDRDVLAVMEDGLRHGGVAAVVGEVKRADMVATRRLQLAATAGGVPALLSRRWRRAGVCPFGEPSAAMTRWRVACAPSAPLHAAGVGRPRWTVELARQRGGPGFSLEVEACDATGRLALPAAPRHRAVAAAGAAARAA